MAVVAVELARAGVHEEQLVAVAVADEVIHRRIGAPETQREVIVGEKKRCIPGGGRARCETIRIESARPQRPFERHPAGRRVAVVHLGRRPVEPFLAELALVRVGGQVGVRLARGHAFDSRERDPLPHQITPLSI
jgi:hypothetical protein